MTYERAGRSHARGYAPPAFQEPARPPPTAAERAADAAASFERCVDGVQAALDAVDAARAANDPERWSEARAALHACLQGASREGERVKELATDASADVSARREAAARRLADAAREAATRTEAPSGLAPVACEADISAILAAPIEGSVAAGYAQKEAALRSLLARLDVTTCRALATRLRRARHNDPIAQAFGQMEQARQARLLRFIDDARRREWERREDELRRPSVRRDVTGAPEPVATEPEGSPVPAAPRPARDARGEAPATPEPMRVGSAAGARAVLGPPTGDRPPPPAAASPVTIARDAGGGQLALDTPPAEPGNGGGLGAQIAAAAGARYLGEGLFELDRTGLRVEVRRTHRSAPRVEPAGELLVLELPRGLAGLELERTLVDQLARLGAEEPAAGASQPEHALASAGPSEAPPLVDAPRPRDTSADGAPLLQQRVRASAAPAGAPRGAQPTGFEVAPAAPADPIAAAQVDVDLLPKELRAALPPAARAVAMSLHVEGDEVVIALQVDREVRIARIEARAALEMLVAGADALAQIGDTVKFLRGLRGQIILAGTRVRVPLWGQPPDASFAVFDLVRAAAGLGRRSAAGFRPVEAQILLGQAGGVRVFGGPDVPAATAIPGEPIGAWFPFPDDGTIRGALGLGGPGEVHGGVFYAGGVLRVAVKPTPEATTGIAAHIDLAYLLGQLKKLGARVAQWIERLLGRLKAGAIDFLSVLRGLMRFELPDLGGSWFEFDLKLQLPRLFKGGGGRGFSLAGLWPSGFHIDLGGFSFGGLPRWKLPWLKLPRLGGFKVPWPKVSGLLDWLPSPGMPSIGLPSLRLPSIGMPSIGMPSIGMPSFPDLDFGLHWPGGFKLGLGIDLSKLWPDLDLAFGFELDLDKLLGKIAGIGSWLLGKLRALGNWANHWIHLGRDGVLRIYDDRVPEGPMLGFHLLRLLDGADPNDLTPTELRWKPAKDDTFTLHMGEAGVAGAAPDPKRPRGKVAPIRPEGHVITSRRGMSPPPSLVTAMALGSGATVDAELVFHDRDRLTVWTQAASAVYDGPQAVRATVSLARIAQAIARLPQARGIEAARLGVVLDEQGSTEGPSFLIGPGAGASAGTVAGATAPGKTSAPRGHIGWKLERLIGLADWSELVPDRLELHVDGAGGVQLGKLRPPVPLRDPPGRFEIEAPALRQKLLLANDSLTKVWAGVHFADDINADDLIAVSLTKTETGDEGALASVHLSFLLRQVERLGAIGRAILDKLASIALPQSGGKSDVLARLGELARALRTKLLRLVDGLLSIELPGGFLRWNLRAQLPRLGEGFDLGALFPELSFELPSLPDLKIELRSSDAFGNPFAGFGIPLNKIRKHLDGIPGLDFSKLVPNIDVAWIRDQLAVSLRLGNLFGDGERSFGFHVPIDGVLEKLQRAGRWTAGKASALRDHVHIGSDGVLRIFDPQKPHGNRIGFDLTRLFDGLSPDDLVPSELSAEVPGGTGGALATLSIGDARVSPQDEADAKRADAERKQHGSKWGKVLVPRPHGEQISAATIPAPAAIRDYLGITDDAARIRVALYFTKDGAVVHATVDGSDRGLSLAVRTAALEPLLAGAFAANNAGADAKKPRLDHAASRARGMLVVGFGDPGKPDHAHGYAAWRLERLLEDPSLSNLLPDELKLARKEGSIVAGVAIDVSQLQKLGTIDLAGWSFARDKLGGHDKADVLTNDEAGFRTAPRVALVAPDEAGAPTAKRTGIELALRADFTAQLRRRARELADGAGRAVRRALSKTDGAGAIDARIEIKPSAGGISIQRGKSTDADHVYVRYGWHQLADLVQGKLDAASLVPDELRLATRAMAVEVKPLAIADAKLPAKAHQIGALHPILRDALVGFGLSRAQWIDLGRSPVTHHDAARARLAATGHIYDVTGTGARDALVVTGGKQVALELDVEALIAQVIPKKKGWNRPSSAPPRARGWSSSVSMKPTADVDHDGKADDPGIEISAELQHRNREGKLSGFRIEAGWSLDQLLELLLHMEQVQTGNGSAMDTTAAGYLAPAHLKGELGSDRFRISFGNDDRPTEHNCLAADVPGLPAALGYILDASTIRGTRLHLDLPSAGQLAGMVRRAASGGFVMLAGCALEVPGPAGSPARFYELTLSVRPDLFKAILKLIPVAGQIYTVVSAAIDVATDLPGAVEALAYTPEGLFQVLESAPELFDRIKEKGISGIALSLVMNSDVSTKKAVLASRIAKLRKQLPSGWKKGDPKPSNLAQIPDDYLVWLADQMEKHPDKFTALDELAAKLGPDALVEERDYSYRGELPTKAEIESRIAQVEKGFTEYATARDAAKQSQDPAAAKRDLEAKAEALRKDMDKLLHSGAKPSATPADHTGPGATKDPDATGRDYSNVDDLPEPTAQQEELASGLFKADDSGSVVVSVPESRYLIQKYAALSVDQLGELLRAGTTMVQTKAGARRALVLIEAERDFVRALFVKYAAAQGVQIKPAAPGTAGAEDRHLVAGYHSAAQDAARKNANAGGSTGTTGGAARTGSPDAGADLADDQAVLDGDDHDDTGDAGNSGAGAGRDTAPGKGKDAAAKPPSATGGSKDKERETEAIERAINDGTARQVARWDANAQRMIRDDEGAAKLMAEWYAESHTGDAIRIVVLDVTDDGATNDGLRIYTITATFHVPVEVERSVVTRSERRVRRTQFFFDPKTRRTTSEQRNPELLAQLRTLGAQIGTDGTKLNGKKIVTSRWTMEIRDTDPELAEAGAWRVATARVRFINVKSQGDRMRNAKREWFAITEEGLEEMHLPLPNSVK
jgi:hypothetical protein